MPSAIINDLEIAYERVGEGPPLLYLNGTGATLATAKPVLDLLAADFEVVAFDQRGIGLSETPASPYAMADLATDALTLADHLGWESFGLLGLSFGGMVAQEVAVTSPERVSRLALLCTSSGGAGGKSFPLDTVGDLPSEERDARLPQILDTRFTPEWLSSHELDRLISAGLREHFSQSKDPHVLVGERLQLTARKGHDVFERLSVISCPTMVAAGRFDGIAPLSNSEAIANQIPHAELHVFEGGHMFVSQDPAALPAVVAFLKGS